MNDANYLIVCLDSCRYDSFVEAHTPNFEKVGALRKVYSISGCTASSLLMLLQNNSQYNDGYKNLIDAIPHLTWIPIYLRGLGYETSMFTNNTLIYAPLRTMFDKGFDRLEGIEYKNEYDAARIMDANIKQFAKPKPQFVFNLLMATHYPYSDGVTTHLTSRTIQIKAAEAVDREFGRLLPRLKNTHVIICADHGELFGEGGGWLHGPTRAVFHEKLFEVPQIKGYVKGESN